METTPLSSRIAGPSAPNPTSPRPELLPAREGESLPELGLLDDEELRQAALAVSVSLTRGRLFLGRCLEEIELRDLWSRWGYSCMNQFVALALKLDPRDAREARRVARALEVLPEMAEAAEAGRIRWAHLREAVRVATPETDGFWTLAASTRSYRALRRMIVRALDGGEPPAGEEAPEGLGTRLWMSLLPEEAELVQAATSALSAQAGRRLEFREVLLDLCRQVVEGRLRTTPAQVEKTRALVAELQELRAGQDRAEFEALGRELAGRDGRPPAGDPKPVDVERHARVAPSPGGASQVREGSPDLDAWALVEELPAMPWAAAGAREAPCPADSSLEVAVAARTPHWEEEGTAGKRLPGRGLRRLVLRRDGFACSGPDCPHSLWLAMHHLAWHCRGGLTVPENLVVCCTRCHQNLHRGNLEVTRGPDGRLSWTDARGRALGSWSEEELERAARTAESRLLGALRDFGVAGAVAAGSL